jgi:hypothetical protein
MWLPVLGFEGLYEIDSDTHNIRRVSTKRAVKINSGCATLCKQGVPYRCNAVELASASITEIAKMSALTVEINENPKPEVFRIDSGEAKNTQIQGDFGEHIVCIELLQRGVHCGMNLMAGAPYDVIGDLGGGRLVKIQVKTATLVGGKYKFRVLPKHLTSCDIVAFVSVETRVVMFICSDLFDGLSKSMSSRELSAAAIGTIDTTLRRLSKTQTGNRLSCQLS